MKRKDVGDRGGRKYLSAEDIFGVQDIKTIEVDVPEWGGSVRLRMMTGEDATRFGEMVKADKENANIKALVMCAVDEDGGKLFTEQDVDRLKKKSLAAIARLAKKAMEINGVGDEAAVKNA